MPNAWKEKLWTGRRVQPPVFGMYALRTSYIVLDQFVYPLLPLLQPLTSTMAARHFSLLSAPPREEVCASYLRTGGPEITPCTNVPYGAAIRLLLFCFHPKSNGNCGPGRFAQAS